MGRRPSVNDSQFLIESHSRSHVAVTMALSCGMEGLIHVGHLNQFVDNFIKGYKFHVISSL